MSDAVIVKAEKRVGRFSPGECFRLAKSEALLLEQREAVKILGPVNPAGAELDGKKNDSQARVSARR